MAREALGWGRYLLTCDDPYNSGCQNQFGPYFGENRIRRLAKEGGWHYSEATDRYACNICMGHHHAEIERRVESGAMASKEADRSGDPFTAAFVTMLLGGDPLTAGLTTAITGDPSLGVIAGMMAGGRREEHSEEQPSAGYTAPVEPHDDPYREHPETRVEAPEDARELPLVVDPFEATAPAQTEESTPSFTAGLPVQEDTVAGSFSAAEPSEPADSSDSSASNSGDSGSDTSY